MANTRTVTIIKESDHKGRNSLNEVQVTMGDRSWKSYYTDEMLKIESLRNELLAQGADEILLDKFKEMIQEDAYQDGIEEGRERC